MISFWNHQNKLFTTHQITKTAVLATLIFVTGTFVQIRLSGKIILQLADGLAFLIILTNPLWMATVACCVGLGLIDLFAGAIVYMPVTIAICLLMVFVIRFGFLISHYFLWMILIFLCASALIYIYVLYTWLLFGVAMAYQELIVDTFQTVFTFIFSCLGLKMLYRIDQNKSILISRKTNPKQPLFAS